MSIKIVLAQPGYRTGPAHLNSWYLPYTIGCLWAYASHNQKIVENISLQEIIWNRPEIEKTIDQWDHLDVLLCSVYVWNENYCCELSKAVKNKFPQVKIIWGGPQCNHTDSKVFEDKPYVDLICVNEGEITFEEICSHLIEKKPLDDIQNCIVNQNRKVKRNPLRPRAEIGNFPSPYTTGVFDSIIESNPDVNWSVIFETNRGCPYSCTYCDWGSYTASKIKKFDLEKIQRELEWFAEKQISWIMIADANFGILKTRDIDIAHMIMEIQTKNKKLQGLAVQFLKNKTDNIVNIGKIVKPLVTNGISIPVQTLDLNTLQQVKRDNMDINDIQDIMKKLDAEEIPYYTELILGMPGETLSSWKQNFWKLYESGFHKAVNVYPLVCCVNTELAKVQVQKNKIKILPIPVIPEDMLIEEFAPVVVETDSMPFNDYIQAWSFTRIQIYLHCTGFSLDASSACRKKGISYEKFYSVLKEKLNENKSWSEVQTQITNLYTKAFSKNKNKITELEIDSVGYMLVFKQRQHIFSAVKKTLEHFQIENINEIILHAESLVYDPENPQQWPKEINGNRYTYVGPPVKNLKEYVDFQAYRRSSIFVNVQKIN